MLMLHTEFLEANLVVRIPDTISFDQAAAAMLKGLTVRYLIKDSFEVKDHHTVLFHAAAGGVGLIAGQWMQVLGAKTIGTAGSDEKCKLAKDHGYGETINYLNEDFLKRTQEISNQSGVDVVYDSVGKDTMFNSFKALKRHGTVVSFGQSSGAYTDLQMTDLAFGSYHLTRPILFHFYANRNWLENASAELFELIGNNKVKLNTKVTNVTFNDEKFEITYQDKAKNEISKDTFDYLVVSTGHFSVPFIPEYKGMNSFPGRIMHSHDFRDAEEF